MIQKKYSWLIGLTAIAGAAGVIGSCYYIYKQSARNQEKINKEQKNDCSIQSIDSIGPISFANKEFKKKVIDKLPTSSEFIDEDKKNELTGCKECKESEYKGEGLCLAQEWVKNPKKELKQPNEKKEKEQYIEYQEDQKQKHKKDKQKQKEEEEQEEQEEKKEKNDHENRIHLLCRSKLSHSPQNAPRNSNLIISGELNNDSSSEVISGLLQDVLIKTNKDNFSSPPSLEDTSSPYVVVGHS